LALVNDRS
jgi:hypothetical protein